MTNETLVFRLFWLLVSLIWMSTEWRLTIKTQSQREIVHSFVKKSEKGLWGTLIVAILLALFFKGQRWLPIPLAYSSRQLVGFIIFGGGILLRYSAVKALGRLFSTRLRIVTEHQVISTGPYRMLRHPSYSGLLLALTGIGIAMGDVIGLFVMLVVAFIALNNRINNEEKLMLEQKNLAYRQYCQKTWKLIPWVY